VVKTTAPTPFSCESWKRKRHKPAVVSGFYGSMNIDLELIEEFKKWLDALGLSKDSVISYASTVRSFCFLKPVAEVNDKKFFAALREILKERNSKLATISRHIFALKKFLVFLSEEKQLPIINIFSIKCRKPPKPSPIYLEKEEIKLVRKLPIRSRFDLRNRVLFEFLLLTGCRISECLNINWQEINFTTNEVTITGKGNKSRVVFLGSSNEWIKRYLAKRNNTASALFLNQYGGRLQRQAATVLIRNLGEKANLTKGIYPHMLRTTFGTWMIRAGVDPRTLQEMMGHEDIETTLRHYVSVSYDHMRLVHSQFAKIL